jgi:hypothetical protein
MRSRTNKQLKQSKIIVNTFKANKQENKSMINKQLCNIIKQKGQLKAVSRQTGY